MLKLLACDCWRLLFGYAHPVSINYDLNQVADGGRVIDKSVGLH